MKTRWFRYRCLALSLLMLFLLQFSIFQPAKAEPTYDKHVRVLLTAFQKTNTLKISIHGSYSLDGKISFQRGSQLDVYLLNNQLMLHYEGMSYAAGKQFHLKSHQAQSHTENGLRFQGEFSLYPGDLSVSIKDNALFPVLTVPIEEYLEGVVPYEMADDFPMEALKAQAIAARTYTIANLKPGKEYDLVDNTNDQVYRGLQVNKKNAIQAVQETRGIICTYKGAPAACLYTASNGGYTESSYNAWGREQIPYLGIQEDRYDLENPLSIIKSAKIGKSADPGYNPDTALLHHYLMDKLAVRLADSYKNADALRYEIKEILNIVPHTTRHGGDHGVMKYLRIDLKVEITGPSLTEEDTEINLSGTGDGGSYQVETVVQTGKSSMVSETISIDCPVFPDIEQLLSLSINRNENELVSVKEKGDSFSIQFRRYGHGVGMSQRGAEWMAKKYHWNYQQILRFYYPGTELKTLDLAPDELKPLDVMYLTTPGPDPSPTPRPTLMPQSSTPSPGQRIVYVTGVAKDSSLNLRLQPDLLSDILARLYYGQELLVLQEMDDGWLQVQTDAMTGFVRSEYVSTVAVPTTP